jgi:hypothetical protein
MDFPISFKLSPKMLYLGPKHPKKWGLIEISHFLPPLLESVSMVFWF